MTTIIPLLLEGLPYPLPILLVLIGTGLLLAEALAPGAHFIVVGIALFLAGLVGVGLNAIGLGAIAVTLGMGATVLVGGALTLYAYREFDLYASGQAESTSDSDALRGKTGRVTERVTPSSGEVKLQNGGFNPNYQARTLTGDIPVGAEVIVTDPGGGNVIQVEALSVIEDDIDGELGLGSSREEREPESS